MKNIHVLKENIYITSNEEIKGCDWVKNISFEEPIFKLDGKGLIYITLLPHLKFKKVILTTDPILIADDVQSIDDEFLEWFVKNPSCESVEVESERRNWKEINYIIIYKIIIPKEEPKLVKQPCIQCDGTGETTFSGTYNSQRKCDLCNGKGYIDSKDISQMQSDLELIQSLQEPKQGTMSEAIKQVISNQLKQKTLEEVAERYYQDEVSINGFINGYKLAKEQTIDEVFEWLTTNNYLTDLKETLIKNFNNFKTK